MSDTMKRMWTDRQIRSMAGDTAKTLIEAGQTENAKPVYCHPINCNFQREGTTLFAFSCLIFNNDDTPFTEETFFAYCKDLFDENPNAVLLASGFVTTRAIACVEDGEDATKIQLASHNSGGTTIDFWSFTLANMTEGNHSFTDGVNKIN